MRFHLGTLTRFYAELPDVDPELIAAWMHWLSKELPHALDWDESPTAPFEIAGVGDWGALIEGGPEQLTQPDLWLPGAHDFLFRTEDLHTNEIIVGSSAELMRALQHAPAHTSGFKLAQLARRSMEFRLPLAKIGS